MSDTLTEVPAPTDLVESIIRYEEGDMDEAEALQFFGFLIRTGVAWELQGSYGRGAAALIRDGLVSPQGEVLVDAL